MLRSLIYWITRLLVGPALGAHSAPNERARNDREDDDYDEYSEEDEDGDPFYNPNYDDTFSRTYPEGFPVWQNHETTAEGWPALRDATVNDTPFYDEFRLKLCDFLGITNMIGVNLALAA